MIWTSSAFKQTLKKSISKEKKRDLTGHFLGPHRRWMPGPLDSSSAAGAAMMQTSDLCAPDRQSDARLTFQQNTVLRLAVFQRRSAEMSEQLQRAQTTRQNAPIVLNNDVQSWTIQTWTEHANFPSFFSSKCSLPYTKFALVRSRLRYLSSDWHFIQHNEQMSVKN